MPSPIWSLDSNLHGRVPDELVDRICSFLSVDLPAVLHVSSRFRRIASPHLLFWLGISLSDVQAGTVKLALSDSLHLILFVAHICPIQRIACFRGLWLRGIEKEKQVHPGSIARFARLAAFSADVAPIPDVIIYDCLGGDNVLQRPKMRHSAVVRLLARLPQTATQHLLVPMDRSMFASAPSTFPPVSREPTRYPRHRWLTWRPFDWERVIANLMILLVNYSLGLMFTWVYQLLTGREWSVEARLTEDLGALTSWDTIRIQMLTENHTLVTFRRTMDHILTMGDLRVQDRDICSVHSALVAKLNWGLSLKHLRTEPGCIITFADLFAILHRHPGVTHLTCEPYSLSPCWSIPVLPSATNITNICAAPTYLPHLLAVTPNVQRIFILFPKCDYSSYRIAADVLDSDAPEIRLHRVTCLYIQNRGLVGHLSRSEPAKEALAAWLSRFPRLSHLFFAVDMFKAMPFDERREYAESVSALCASLNPSDVRFSLPYDETMPWPWVA
ncbi:hypothetical protein FB45DRAFT_890129 [Roridomyces roridus]|uniref:F-box domain-containing protein n=1 Tax=Roridomyces roridus TaxID=1738132 RepID=A0AAD7G3B5_9AGAR|nr:hypothetical protein FB45DRAFT_890129 [Roridomyces roridus]